MGSKCLADGTRYVWDMWGPDGARMPCARRKYCGTGGEPCRIGSGLLQRGKWWGIVGNHRPFPGDSSDDHVKRCVRHNCS